MKDLKITPEVVAYQKRLDECLDWLMQNQDKLSMGIQMVDSAEGETPSGIPQDPKLAFALALMIAQATNRDFCKTASQAIEEDRKAQQPLMN